MKVSYQWLQSRINGSLPEPEKVAEAITFHAFEIDSITREGEDTVFDIKILPDRAHDCLSHRGIAREVAAIFKVSFKKEELPSPNPTQDFSFPVEVQSELCRRYIGAIVRGVKIGPSPDWLKKRLEVIGQKSINNIVDATNFILFDLGQPIHAFDLAKIDKGIVVRSARAGERFMTLSGEEKELTEEMLVIADYVGILGLAGVKGGKTAEVSTDTTDIFIEVANFDPISIRKTARKLGLLTDAAKRFENEITPALAAEGMSAILSLITTIAGGTVEGVFDYYPIPVTPWTIEVPLIDVQRLLGKSITLKDITETFDRYGYQYQLSGETVLLTPPLERLDLQGVHDVAEDVGRMVGLEHFEPKLITPPLPVSLNETFVRMQESRCRLIEAGYQEVLTYSFRKKGEVQVAYGSKETPALRTNLLEGLRESYELNKKNKELLNVQEIKLFEIGTVFFEDREEIHIATIDSTGEQEIKLEAFIPEISEVLSKLPTATLGVLFKPWSPYPYIVRDVAVWATDDQKETLEQIVNEFGKTHTALGPSLFDSFSKDGRVSYAYRFVFLSFEKTLTDTEVNEIFQKLHDQLKQSGFEIR